VRTLAYFLPLLLVALLAAGCVGFNNPDGWASAEVSGDVLYLTLDRGELTAVDAASYDVIWQFPEADEQACGEEDPELRELEGIYAAPVIAGGAVYFGAWDGNVYALDEATGDCTWDFETNDPIIGGLTLMEDRLYAASTDGNLYVIDPETGAEIARAHAGDVWSRPAVADGVLYVGNVGGDLRAFDPETLDQVWDAPFSVPSGLLTDPQPLDGSVIVGGLGEKLFAIDAETGDELWAFEAGNWFWGRPVVEAGAVYATNLDSRVYAVDIETGSGIWDFGTEAPMRAGPVLAGDVVIAVDNSGNVYGLDPLTGDLIWNVPTEIDKTVHADPYVLPDGNVMIVTRGGDVFTVAPEDGRLTTIRIQG